MAEIIKIALNVIYKKKIFNEKKMLLSIHSQFKRNQSLSNDIRPLLYGHPDT
jgi:hypothetical protein